MLNFPVRMSKKVNMVYALFLTGNVILLGLALHAFYISTHAFFGGIDIHQGPIFWIGAIKNLILISGAWIFMDAMFATYFFLKCKIRFSIK